MVPRMLIIAAPSATSRRDGAMNLASELRAMISDEVRVFVASSSTVADARGKPERPRGARTERPA